MGVKVFDASSKVRLPVCRFKGPVACLRRNCAGKKTNRRPLDENKIPLPE